MKVMHKGFVLLNCDLGAEEFIVEELREYFPMFRRHILHLEHMMLLQK